MEQPPRQALSDDPDGQALALTQQQPRLRLWYDRVPKDGQPFLKGQKEVGLSALLMRDRAWLAFWRFPMWPKRKVRLFLQWELVLDYAALDW